jgi:hypothetical protein
LLSFSFLCLSLATWFTSLMVASSGNSMW